ncbi:MAG: hypothetical protein DHS20C09_20700 [marine bacterium B5-7]|nr:MAG: hypothetical protein DHS20C09_20700 [marine bacterium B5-7]
MADYKYSSTAEHPFGQYNQAAPPEILDFSPLIGQADCQSMTRVGETWSEPISMIWTFRYIMNGTAIQDDTLKSDGTHSGSIRQFNPETDLWHVHYYTSKTIADELPVWTGGKVGSDLIFWRTQKAPNGMAGFYRLTFSEITETGYQWLGAWVDESKTVSYPTWKINCKKAVLN